MSQGTFSRASLCPIPDDMNERRRRRIAPLAVALVVSAVAGCETEQPDGATQALDSARTSASVAIASAKAVPGASNLDPPDKPLPAAGAPGPAYFAVEGKGLIALAVSATDGQAQFSLVEGSPREGLRDLQRAPSGAVYVKAPEGIMKLDRGEGTSAGKLDVVAKIDRNKLGNVHHLTVSADEKTLWVSSLNGVSRWDGSEWTLEPRETIGKGVRVIEGIAVGAGGQLWLADSNSLHVRTETGWKDVTPVSDRKQFFKSIEPGPNGEVFALASGALYRCAGTATELVDVGLRGRLLFQHLSVTNNGLVGFKSNKREVGRTQPGAALRTYSAKEDQVLADGIEHVALDERGRIWVVSRSGVSIVGPGDERVDWPSSSVDMLSGTIKGVLVVGAGPELPSAGESKRGGLQGKLLVAGVPLSGADVELCARPEVVFKESPCAKASTRLTGKTDEKGAFVIRDAPLGKYGIAAKVGEDWQVQGASANQQMKEGEVFDFGTITLAVKP